VIAVAKGSGGLVTGSSAMLAETAHSIADTVDQVLLLVSLRLGERQPDEEHPFGYGKERFFWTFLVAVVIFLARIDLADGVESSRVEELANELDRSLRETDAEVDQVLLDPPTRSE
jgi:divalent metal cation (Fe/Co/Zn/Cd) transporter